VIGERLKHVFLVVDLTDVNGNIRTEWIRSLEIILHIQAGFFFNGGTSGQYLVQLPYKPHPVQDTRVTMIGMIIVKRWVITTSAFHSLFYG
jgi:hypothetical protein